MCPNNCTGAENGFCDTSRNPPVCSCNEGWTGDDCSEIDGGDGDSSFPIAAVVVPVVVGPIILLTMVAFGAAAVWMGYHKWQQRRHTSAAMSEMVNFS